MNIFDMDSDTLMLAIQLQREDLELWEKSRKGKHREGEVHDSDLAMEMCRCELDNLDTIFSDRNLGLSISRAVETDANAIAKLTALEEEAAKDREFALRLSSDPRARPKPNRSKSQKVDEPLDDDFIRKLKALNIVSPVQAATGQEAEADGDVSELPQAESSGWAATRRTNKTRECVCCGDRFPPPALSECPCSHEYCRECLVTLVQSSLRDESLFPPRCCRQPIPIETKGRFLPPELIGEFRAKKIESETPNRVYCSDPFCSTFVPPQFIKTEVAHCPRCHKKTCALCKGETHSGVCPSDTASQEVLRIAAENGWQRCQACGRVVELDIGCNHMSKCAPITELKNVLFCVVLHLSLLWFIPVSRISFM
ncbi:hypothetical protein FZEAL_1811 [Fusarium zealandicum]|uniref:IBR domain-containing protein n=1 Tax=Fusarium zealandicum TaxID=1053134 RepID=A0A8H4US87_9HYPO|nr:hypothetical protein FZEAL_1811 [Fusarium zealandicum]